MTMQEDWSLLDWGLDAGAGVLTDRGRVPAGTLGTDDVLITMDGVVALQKVETIGARRVVQLVDREHRLTLAPGQLLHCSHWACKPLIGCDRVVIPAAAMWRRVERTTLEHAIPLVRLTPVAPAAIEVEGFRLALVPTCAVTGVNWQGLASPLAISAVMQLADPNSAQQLDSAGIATRCMKSIKNQYDIACHA